MAKLQNPKAPKSGMEQAIQREKEACAALGESTENLDAVLNEIDNPEKTPEQELTELIPVYQMNKVEMDSYKKLVDKDNSKIKAIMGTAELEEFIVGDLKANYSVSNRTGFNTEVLLAKLKEMGKSRGIIKKMEYVDMDALENAIYAGKIDAALLADCQTTSQVVTLKITKVKK